MLGSFVVLYLFLGGCGAGVLLAAAAWSLAFRRGRCPEPGGASTAEVRAFGALCGRLYAVALVTLVAAASCLLLDLGRPERFLLLFTRPTPSLISVGSFVLAACLLTAASLAADALMRPHVVPRTVRCGLEVLAIGLSAAMMLYTGLYLACMEAVPLWNNGALPVLLAASSASSGLAVVLIAIPFGRDWRLLGPWIDRLHRIHGWVLVVELLALAAFAVLALAQPFAAPALGALTAPEGLGPWFAVGFGGFGLLLPLAAEAVRRPLGLSSPALAAEVLCVAGGLILRFCLVWARSHGGW